MPIDIYFHSTSIIIKLKKFIRKELGHCLFLFPGKSIVNKVFLNANFQINYSSLLMIFNDY